MYIILIIIVIDIIVNILRIYFSSHIRTLLYVACLWLFLPWWSDNLDHVM